MPSAKRIVPQCKPCAKESKPPEPCIKCRLSPGTASFGVCEGCYQAMPAKARERLDRLEKREASERWADVEPPAVTGRATEEMPGSFEKVLILAERIGKGLDPWHPEDEASEPKDLEKTVIESFLKTDVGGVHWCNWNGGHRAYPWFTVGPFKYKRYHLGYFEDRDHAIAAVRDWRRLADKIGPQKAMIDIRKRWRWATRIEQQNRN